MMKTQVVVDEVVVLANGKVMVATTIIQGKPLAPKMVGRNPSQGMELEVVSVALVNSPPAPVNKQGLHVRMLKGECKLLKGAVIDFE